MTRWTTTTIGHQATHQMTRPDWQPPLVTAHKIGASVSSLWETAAAAVAALSLARHPGWGLRHPTWLRLRPMARWYGNLGMGSGCQPPSWSMWGQRCGSGRGLREVCDATCGAYWPLSSPVIAVPLTLPLASRAKSSGCVATRSSLPMPMAWVTRWHAHPCCGSDLCV